VELASGRVIPTSIGIAEIFDGKYYPNL
jgi:hypothetical protein